MEKCRHISGEECLWSGARGGLTPALDAKNGRLGERENPQNSDNYRSLP